MGEHRESTGNSETEKNKNRDQNNQCENNETDKSPTVTCWTSCWCRSCCSTDFAGKFLLKIIKNYINRLMLIFLSIFWYCLNIKISSRLYKNTFIDDILTPGQSKFRYQYVIVMFSGYQYLYWWDQCRYKYLSRQYQKQLPILFKILIDGIYWSKPQLMFDSPFSWIPQAHCV